MLPLGRPNPAFPPLILLGGPGRRARPPLPPLGTRSIGSPRPFMGCRGWVHGMPFKPPGPAAFLDHPGRDAGKVWRAPGMVQEAGLPEVGRGYIHNTEGPRKAAPSHLNRIGRGI